MTHAHRNPSQPPLTLRGGERPKITGGETPPLRKKFMSLSGSQLVLKALQDENIGASFGIPGTHNIELYDTLLDGEFPAYLVTDEQCASFMADGFARSSGEVAVVNVVPGAGLTHAMSGIAEAYLDQIPMLVLACGIRTDSGKAYQLHDVDQAAIVRPVCKQTFSAKTHDHIYAYIRKAVALAKEAPCGPVFVEIPANLYLFKSNLKATDLTTHDGLVTEKPDGKALEKIVSLINQSQNIGLYLGQGAIEAGSDLVKLADTLDAVVFTTLTGKGVYDETQPRFVWNSIGRALPPQLVSTHKDLDLMIAIGCRFSEVATASYGAELPTLIHIDVDPSVFNKNFKAEVTLKARSKTAVTSILTHLLLKKKTLNQEKLNKLVAAKKEVRDFQISQKSTDRVSPATLFEGLQRHFGDDAAYVTDSGNGTFMAMEQLKLTKPRRFLGPIDYSCMGYSVPAAIGAKIANPQSPVICLSGDGAFLMTGLELVTAKANDVACVFMVLNDGELSQIAQFQRQALGRQSLTTLPGLNFEKLADSVGMKYRAIKTDGDIEDVLQYAKNLTVGVGSPDPDRGRGNPAPTGEPVLIEVLIDYSFTSFFTKGVIKTNFLRLPLKDRIRFAGRVVKRKIFK